MKEFNTKYSYSDISLIPSAISNVSSRSECNVYYKNGRLAETLPLFTSPMSSVVSDFNYETFQNNLINPIIPRTVSFFTRVSLCDKIFSAFSISEAEDFIKKDDILLKNKIYHICIDVANGHMKKLHDIIREIKTKYPLVLIMSGNVASPDGYRELSNVGCDYVRVGIGGGRACITSSNTSIHYPMASLVRDCWLESLTMKLPAYIIADGGVRNYSDVIKALALGADFVMCGSIFSKMLESSGDLYIENAGAFSDDVKYVRFAEGSLSDKYINEFTSKEFKFYKSYYGMSTKKAQREMNVPNVKTAEGIELMIPVEYTMSQWKENFIHYLSSAMSYTNKLNLIDFIGLKDEHFINLSQGSINSINK